MQLCGAPGAVRDIGHVQSVQLRVEGGAAAPQPGYGLVQGLAEVTCVLSDVSKCGVAQDICKCCVPVSPAGCSEIG